MILSIIRLESKNIHTLSWLTKEEKIYSKKTKWTMHLYEFKISGISTNKSKWTNNNNKKTKTNTSSNMLCALNQQTCAQFFLYIIKYNQSKPIDKKSN